MREYNKRETGIAIDRPPIGDLIIRYCFELDLLIGVIRLTRIHIFFLSRSNVRNVREGSVVVRYILKNIFETSFAPR